MLISDNLPSGAIAKWKRDKVKRLPQVGVLFLVIILLMNKLCV
jgi:hypothetical protein